MRSPRTPLGRAALQAEYSFFFDTGGRRRAYIAPERFFSSAAEARPAGLLSPEMVRRPFHAGHTARRSGLTLTRVNSEARGRSLPACCLHACSAGTW